MAIREHILLSGASLLKLVSFTFWSWLYLWTAASLPGRSPEWYSRVVTLLHGSIAATIGLIQCNFMQITVCRLTAPVTMAQYALMVWSWGYFAMDFIWCLVYWSENLVMLCHHLSAIYAVDVYMHKQNVGCTFACTLAMMEVTNPLLQTRWLIKHEGLEKSKLFLIVEVTYLVLFIVVRGVIGTYVVYKILSSDIFDLDEKILTVIFFAVSWAFLYEIYGYVRYKYKNRFISVFDDTDNGADKSKPTNTMDPITTRSQLEEKGRGIIREVVQKEIQLGNLRPHGNAQQHLQQPENVMTQSNEQQDNAKSQSNKQKIQLQENVWPAINNQQIQQPENVMTQSNEQQESIKSQSDEQQIQLQENVWSAINNQQILQQDNVRPIRSSLQQIQQPNDYRPLEDEQQEPLDVRPLINEQIEVRRIDSKCRFWLMPMIHPSNEDTDRSRGGSGQNSPRLP